jgi:hypothetical protein
MSQSHYCLNNWSLLCALDIWPLHVELHWFCRLCQRFLKVKSCVHTLNLEIYSLATSLETYSWTGKLYHVEKTVINLRFESKSEVNVINLTPEFAKRYVIENLWQNATLVNSSRMQLNEIFNLILISFNYKECHYFTKLYSVILINFFGQPNKYKNSRWWSLHN